MAKTARSRWIPLAVFAVIAVFLGVGLTLKPREVPSPLIGKPAPAFSLPQLHQASQVIGPESLRGKVYLLNVWASWCGSCRVEHPHLMELARSGRVPVYGLNYKDGREAGIEWLNRYGDPYVASAFDADGRVAIDYGVYGAPETFLVDARGVIRYKHIGPLTPDVIEGKLMPLVQEISSRG